MPELPEVETIKRSLKPLVIGKVIERVEIIRPEPIKYPGSEIFRVALEGCRVIDIDRRGKYLILKLDNDARLVIHLRMTGQFVHCPADAEMRKHTHLVFQLADGGQLRFTDIRRFGCLWLLESDEEDQYTGMAQLGPEPFDADLDGAWLSARLAGRKTSLKQALLDQHLLAGLGNIYVDEALFAAGLSPFLFVTELLPEQASTLLEAIRQVLNQGIDNLGTSFSDYRDGRGEKGSNQDYLQVYQRKSQPCPRCGNPIQRAKLGGRSTFFCYKCQKS
jgi:formamidopyrimidine-DNA glycosylase